MAETGLVLLSVLKPGRGGWGWGAEGALSSQAESRWEKMWGRRQAGPFNIACLDETWPSPPDSRGRAAAQLCLDPAWLGGCQNCETRPQPVPYPPH